MARNTKIDTKAIGAAAEKLPAVRDNGSLTRGVVDHLVARATPYLAPWAGAYTLPPALGGAAHVMWTDTALEAGLACGAIGIAGTGLAALTWKVASGDTPYRRYRRVQATASVAAAMGWLTCAVAAGPLAPGVVDAWLLGAGAFAASWNIRQVLRNSHDETEQQDTSGGLLEKIGLAKFRLKQVKAGDKGIVTARVEVPEGRTLEDMQDAAPRLAAATRIPPSGVTVHKNPDDASRGSLTLRVADLLKDGVRWEPPKRMGMYPDEPIPVGVYADGEPVLINPFGAPILQHTLVMGVTGAGKSEFARGLLTHLATRRKITLIVVDCAKGKQSIGHIADGIDWVVSDRSEAKRLLRALPAAIAARGDVLAREGLDQWTRDSSLNAVVLWIEEATDVADIEQLDEIARKARSVGIWLVISLQRATWTNVSTDVRANLQSSVCFGVDRAEDAAFCLPDSVIAAGACPDWGSSRPGYAYATGMGIPENRWAIEWRSGLTNREELAALVAAGAEYRDPLDQVTAAALGPVYEQRSHRGTNRTTTTALPQAAPATLVRGDAPAEEPHDLEASMNDGMDDEIQDVRDEILGGIPADPEPDAEYAELTLEDDVPETDPDTTLQFEPAARPSTEEARRILYDQIAQWAAQGRLEFEPADLIPAVTAAGRKRPWMQAQLKRLVEDGVLDNPAHGEYVILRSPLVPA